jgi:hypothetical protein
MDEIKGSGKKFDQGKPMMGLIPVSFKVGMAQVFGFGGVKYGYNNFRLGMAHSKPLDAVQRHVDAILAGEEIDPESGLPHRYHAGCSLAIYDYQVLNHPDLCDLYEVLKRRERELKHGA